MEEVVKKGPVPAMPEEIKIQGASWGALPSQEIHDISPASIRDMVEKIRTGASRSLMLTPDEYGEEGYLMLESSPDLIFLQVWDAEAEIAWACFNPDLLDSDEEAPIEPSDGQSVFPLKCTMKDREMAAKCVEWYAHTCEPYPGMDWLKERF